MESLLNMERDALNITTFDFRNAELRKDHEHRPCWCCPNLSVYLEKSSPLFRQATEFLVAVAEPISRPEFIHHYNLTSYSLYAGTSSGLDTERILHQLQRFNKGIKLPYEMERFVRTCTESFGKAKLVLKRQRLFVESEDESVLLKLLKNETIRTSRIVDSSGSSTNETGIRKELVAGVQANVVLPSAAHLANATASTPFAVANSNGGTSTSSVSSAPTAASTTTAFNSTNTKNDDILEARLEDEEDEEEEHIREKHMCSFEVDPIRIDAVRQEAHKMNFPLMEEYDFRRDNVNPDLDITLTAKNVRDYQSKALSKMFGNGRARSGVIVLPCGAGKTLTGITACCTIKKACMVLCTSSVACLQWKHQFKHFCRIADRHLMLFTSGIQTSWPVDGSPVVLLTTYFMMGMDAERRSQASRDMISQISKREWGLLLLDEVHVAPANKFRAALKSVKCHSKLGLTATLVREDGLIDDLNFLIGPKLYEADWMDLTERGYLARVLCVEVRCPMAPDFMATLLTQEEHHKRELLYVMNPYKFAAVRFLIDVHKQKEDKILIFSENVYAIRAYAEQLHVWCMYGATKDAEREVLLRRFRMSGEPYEPDGPINILILSRVGDVALDLPEANVIIQISSHYGSRRQEAQRLGRILRPKPSAKNQATSLNAFFYSLVTLDTEEMTYSNKRRQYLVDQGYTYQCVRNLVDWPNACNASLNQAVRDKWRTDCVDTATVKSVLKSSQEDLPKDTDAVDVEVGWNVDQRRRT